MALPALAQDGPLFGGRTARIIVPASAGGGIDLMGRTLAEKLTAATGESVVVENRAGASGVLGVQAAVQAAPDGHTMLIGSTTSISIRPRQQPPLPYDVDRDLMPLAVLAMVPHVIVVNAKLPIRDIKTLLERNRIQPVSFGDGGEGTPHSVSVRTLQRMLSTTFTQVNYKGSADALRDVVAGHVDATYVDLSQVVEPYIRSGQVRAIAVTTAERSRAWPDIPTVAEQGVAGFETVSWFGLFVPAKTPADMANRLATAVNNAMGDEQSRGMLVKLGMQPVSIDRASATAFINRENRKWQEAIAAQTTGSTK